MATVGQPKCDGAPIIRFVLAREGGGRRASIGHTRATGEECVGFGLGYVRSLLETSVDAAESREVGGYNEARPSTSLNSLRRCASDMSMIGSYMNELTWMFSGVISTTESRTPRVWASPRCRFL